MIFDSQLFKFRYPEFSLIADQTLESCFNEATLYCDNSPSSRVTDEAVRMQLLNMLTAHIVKINNLDMVGRVSEATEGTVTVKTDFPLKANSNMSWYAQTKYGSAYWAATSKFRTMRYVSG